MKLRKFTIEMGVILFFVSGFSFAFDDYNAWDFNQDRADRSCEWKPSLFQKANSSFWNYGSFVIGGGALGWIAGSQISQRFDKFIPQTTFVSKTTMVSTIFALGGSVWAGCRLNCLYFKIDKYYGSFCNKEIDKTKAEMKARAKRVDNEAYERGIDDTLKYLPSNEGNQGRAERTCKFCSAFQGNETDDSVLNRIKESVFAHAKQELKDREAIEERTRD